jgi:phosphonopyruvate decarboxylase
LKHILLDNNAHESTGGQPTVSHGVDFTRIAEACGYEHVESAADGEQLAAALQQLEASGKLSLLVVKVKKGSRSDLGRPTTTPRENRDGFIENFR